MAAIDWTAIKGAFDALLGMGSTFLDTSSTLGILVVTGVAAPLVFKVIGRAVGLVGGRK